MSDLVGSLHEYQQAKANQAPPANVARFPFTAKNEILDSERQYVNVDLLQYVADDHLLKRYALYLAERTQVPPSTTFLIGLSVFSSMACRKWCIQYPDGDTLPLGLYTVAEQPPGVGKTRVTKSFQAVFYQLHEEEKENINKEINRLESLLNRGEKLPEDQYSHLDLLKLKRKAVEAPLFVTNATPEGLEVILNDTGGYFSAVSSEQGLFDSLLGFLYGPGTGANNNDIVLYGFDGGYSSGSRVSRKAFVGKTIGSVVCFAQPGSIEKLIKASNGAGIAERFLMLNERHRLGQRDHNRPCVLNPELEAEYFGICLFAKEFLQDPIKPKDLKKLALTKDGYKLIADYQNSIEPHLADGGKFSHIAARGAAGKVNMQILKIAANLHLLTHERSNPIIHDHLVSSAIAIANDLLEANLQQLLDKGITGQKAEYEAVIKYLTNKHGVKTERDIINSLRNTQPFKDYTGDRNQLIRETLEEMTQQSILNKGFNVILNKKTPFYVLSQ